MSAVESQVAEIVWRDGWFSARIAISLVVGRFPGFDHLEVRCLEPEGHPLPVTATGYRSHFRPTGEILSLDAAADEVRWWLDENAAAPEWRKLIRDGASQNYSSVCLAQENPRKKDRISRCRNPIFLPSRPLRAAARFRLLR